VAIVVLAADSTSAGEIEEAADSASESRRNDSAECGSVGS
jgi:hypothetical protein